MKSRRQFFKTAGAAVAAAAWLESVPDSFASPNPQQFPITLGMASYTFRKFTLDDCLKMTVRLGLKRIAFKSFHLPLDATKDQILDTVRKVRDAGLELYGGGVIYMKDEKEVNQAFEYCRIAGMQVMIGVPNYELLDMVEEKVKAYDILVAIHNHGPDNNLYPSPESVYSKIQNRDKRMGLCMDIGHTQRLNLDPSAQFEKYHDRIYDIHIKDVSSSSAAGTTVEIGRGVIDIPKFMRTLAKYHYMGTASLEYEKDEDDPLPGSAESIGYLRGVMADWQ
jgi:inosose dehydratase